jgi:hypothetical protein
MYFTECSKKQLRYLLEGFCMEFPNAFPPKFGGISYAQLQKVSRSSYSVNVIYLLL